ncbi:hypothetical protein [Marinoscillum furvescens]|uniref:Tetratricopeptide repeat protein n=1 Tax=Marinoscillum furvescens DSM 4134 TaxID=1122208 RepID=A0A3D9L1J9_MARFU|nr:hypothetical protein [Marinoscillum furvescens]RED94413.1 hypothetical protein C7460_121100 [Marinoscillum furvescens DSM 4134]
MKTIQKMIGALALVGLLTFTATASSTGESKSVKKAKEAVEEAAGYDWKTLAESAQVCFKKDQNIDQAMIWIEKSIEIQEDPFNLEILADYYASKGENDLAMSTYVRAIDAGRAQNFWYDNSHLQAKIWELR